MFILFIVIVVPCYHATGKQGVIIIFVALKVFYYLFITTPLRAMIASRGRGKRRPIAMYYRHITSTVTQIVIAKSAAHPASTTAAKM